MKVPKGAKITALIVRSFVDGFSISDLWLPPINLRWTGETPNPGRFHFPKLETMILGIQKNFLGKIELNLATLSPKVFRNV